MICVTEEQGNQRTKEILEIWVFHWYRYIHTERRETAEDGINLGACLILLAKVNI